MLSRLAFRSVAGLPALKSSQIQPAALAAFHTNTKDVAKTQELIDNWERCNKKYYGPERDLVNFPHPTITDQTPAVRLGFIPASWFDALYSKTGVSGPYFTLGGLVTYLLSKEIWVADHQFFEFLGYWLAIYFIVKWKGADIAKFLDARTEKLDNKNFHSVIELTRSSFAEAVGKIDTQIDQEGRHKFVFDTQRENVDLQLEARYRERVAEVHSAVKRRLDYQVELVNTRKRFEQDHMVNWIVDNVVKGVTPKQEKDAITSCIANLKTLAKSNPAV